MRSVGGAQTWTPRPPPEKAFVDAGPVNEPPGAGTDHVAPSGINPLDPEADLEAAVLPREGGERIGPCRAP